jgi:hypothetical protein
MNEDRRRVLDMLAEGKISVDEAERLLSQIGRPSPPGRADDRPDSRAGAPRYLRVVVEPEGGAEENGSHHGVNIRVPLAILRAGMRLTALIPDAATAGINQALREKGIDLDVGTLKTEDVEHLLDALRDIEVDVHTGEQRVLIYIE